MKYDINIRHLEYFVKVSKLGSINKAAWALYISQPYLGKIMHDLEATVGIRLMNRSRATLLYMISISDCYSIGIHDFTLQVASYQTTSIPRFYAGVRIQRPSR